ADGVLLDPHRSHVHTHTHTQRSGYKVNYDTASNPQHTAPTAQSRHTHSTLTSLIHPHAVTGSHHQVPSLPLEAPSNCLKNEQLLHQGISTVHPKHESLRQ